MTDVNERLRDLESHNLWDIVDPENENVADMLSEEAREAIASAVVADYDADKNSRSTWEDRMKEALELALQIREHKTFPWDGASNVKFPLITIAAMQFHSRVYPAMVPGPEIVKCRVIGKDEDGSKQSRADRIARHLNYQLLDEDEDWEEQSDRLLITLPIMGCEFKKVYWDDDLGGPKSDWVMANDLVIPYLAKSVESAIRKTQIIEMYRRDIIERQRSGFYLDFDLPAAAIMPRSDSWEMAKDARSGFERPLDADATPHVVLEQHRFLDLDGDGYSEPYIVTVDKSSSKMLRLTRRFEAEHIITSAYDQLKDMGRSAQSMMQNALQSGQDEVNVINAGKQLAKRMTEIRQKAKIIKIRPIEHFVKYSFIPSPDGGIYDLGFGSLLGPINETVNTLINQMVDNGTMSNSSSGFIGAGGRIKSGVIEFKPFHWERIDSYGQNVRNALVPLPINPTNPVLFNLLELMINYGQRLASVSDQMQGIAPGQNTPATTTMATMEQGLKVFNGIFKRVYRGFRCEYRRRYQLNGLYLDPEKYVGVLDEDPKILQMDYEGDSKDVSPQAEASYTSEESKIMKARFLSERSSQVPGYNTAQAELRLLQAIGMEDINDVYPTQRDKEGKLQAVIQPPPNQELQLEAADVERRTAESKARMNKDFANLQIQSSLAEAEISEREARTLLLLAQAEKEQTGIDLDKLRGILDTMKESRENLKVELDQRKAEADEQLAQEQAQQSNGKEESSE